MVKFEHILNTSILLIYPILVRGICKIYKITMHVLFYFTFDSFSKIIFNVTIHVYSPVYGMIDLLRDNCIKYSSLLYSPAQVTSRSYRILSRFFEVKESINIPLDKRVFPIPPLQSIFGYTLYVHVSSLIDKWDLDRIHAQGGMIWTTSSDCSFAFGVF